MHVDVAVLHDLVTRILCGAGLSLRNATIVARVVVAAERDGAVSHGLFRLPGYLATMQSGWVDGHATPIITHPAPSLLLADAGNGFAQVALEGAREPLCTVAREQ